MNEKLPNDQPTSFGFLLVNDFTLISMSSAVEPLRMANRIAKTDVYRWRTISESGEDVVASDGLSINAEYGIDDVDVLSDLDAVIVCGGRRIQDSTSDPVIHWENLSALTDMFPNTSVTRRVYTIDRDRYTSSGGTAPVDMMLHFVTKKCGAEVSAGVAEQFVHERVRHADDRQRVPLKHTVGNQSEKLVVAVELMEANIREPICQPELAAYVNLSRRQLQRLFQRYLACTPSRHYLQIRLQKAREL